MSVVDIQRSVKLSVAIAEHAYTGEKDGCHFRHGDGEEVWQSGPWRQQYTGQFLQDCLHNYGSYTWKNIDTRVEQIYSGKFFTNNLEGYGILSYPDGQIFEGLFKSNIRYGPGVLTYPDGSQDVGLWEGNNLVRLNQILPNKSLPLLSQSIQGKAYLLNYKSLVPIQEKPRNKASEILSELNATNSVLEKSNLLYSKFVKNKNSLFFNQKLYCDDYFNNDEDWTINVVESYGENEVPIMSQVLVTHLLAWNNEKLAISFMKHTFKHRNYEEILGYNVSQLFTGQRDIFRDPGEQETACVQFLESCCEDNEAITRKILINNNLYPDISDFQGNNGMIYAATYDRTGIIKILMNFGANVDHINDECLTALNMSILRYTACKFEVNIWEDAFLPQIQEKENAPQVQQWRTSNVARRETIQNKEKYLYDLSCIKPEEKVKKVKEKKEKMEKPKKEKKSIKNKTIEETIIIDPKIEPMEKILNTISCLLNCGAKPNYGNCPFPPLILSIFARCPEIVNLLLQFGADTNIRTTYHLGSLTPLHILASLPPSLDLISMADILLNNGANPNLSANSAHWEEEKNIILAETQTEDDGKTPLHLLCMRYDFFDDPNDYLGELCKVLIDSGACPNIFYIGHTCLTLAMLRGNIKLMYRILDSGIVDPNQELGNNMGVPLTVLILKRYENILPVNICEKIFHCLLEFYANPFNDLPEFQGNAIEFCLEENKPKEISKPESPNSNKSGNSGKSSKPGKSEKTSNTGKSKDKPKGEKMKGHQHIIQLLNKAAEVTLIKRIQRKAVQLIYEYKIECGFDDPIFYAIVKYVNLEQTVLILQMLLDNDQINPCKYFCFALLDFIESEVKGKSQNKPGKKGKFPPKTIEDLLEELDFDKNNIQGKQLAFKILRPELDPEDEKFKVCFECFQRKNKILMLCPECNLVYFCSQACNLKNNHRKDTKHPCKLLFYNDQLKLMQEKLGKGLPVDEGGPFDRFNILKQDIAANSSDYFERIKPSDQQMLELQAERKSRVSAYSRASRSKTKDSKDISKDKKSKSRSGSDIEKEKKDKKSKGKRSKSRDIGIEKKKKGEGKSKKYKDDSSEEGDKHGRRKSKKRKDGSIEKGDKHGRRKSKKRKDGSIEEGDKHGRRKSKKRKDGSVEEGDKHGRRKSKKRKDGSVEEGDKHGRRKSKKRKDSTSEEGDKHGRIKSKKRKDGSIEKKGKQERIKSKKREDGGAVGDKHGRRKSKKRKDGSIEKGRGKSKKRRHESVSTRGKKEKGKRESKKDKWEKSKADKESKMRQKSISADRRMKDQGGKLEGKSQVRERSISTYKGRRPSPREEKTGADALSTDAIRESIKDITSECEKFDYKFFQMFTPYCVLVNGQLYYKFVNVNWFYKLASYSHI